MIDKIANASLDSSWVILYSEHDDEYTVARYYSFYRGGKDSWVKPSGRTINFIPRFWCPEFSIIFNRR